MPTSFAAPKPKAAAVVQDELARATIELDAFNAKTHNAAGAVADPNLALQSADLQLKVVEATTEPRIKGFAQLEQNVARLADVKAKLALAKKPKAPGKPAPADTLAQLEQRRSTALDSALLLQASYLLNFLGLFEMTHAEALHSAAPETRWVVLQRDLRLVQSPAAKAEAKRLGELVRDAGLPQQAWSSLGNGSFESMTDGSLGHPDVTQACRKLGKDELAWDLLTLQSATQIAMTKAPPRMVVAARMPHHDAGTTAGVARDVKRALFGSSLQATAALEALKGCADRAAAARAPAGAGSLTRSLFVGAAAAEPLEELVTQTGYDINGGIGERTPAATAAKAQRAALDKQARVGADALARYKGALQRSKDGKVDTKDLLAARDALSAAKQAGASVVKQRASVRKSEDEMMAALGEADGAVTRGKEGMRAGKEAQKALAALLAQQGRDAGTDSAKKAAAARASSIGKGAPDVVGYADLLLTEARAALNKHTTKAGLGSIADYPKRLAQAQKEDAGIAQQLKEVEAQLKGVDALLSQDSARCDVRKIDWKNAKYDFGKLKNGEAGQCEDTCLDTGFCYGQGELRSFQRAEYGDIDGDGVLDAIVHVAAPSCARGMPSDYTYVFGTDARCVPVQRASLNTETCSKKKLSGKAILVDRKECYDDKQQQRWQLVGNNLQQAR